MTNNLIENGFLMDVIFELMKMNKVKLWVLFGLLVNSQFQGICSVPSDKVVHVEESILPAEQPKNEAGQGRSISPESLELYGEILHMDSVLFNAFNAQDLEQMKNTFSTDLEFYHDKGGLTDYNQTIANFKSLFEKNLKAGLRRDLEISSVEVYSIRILVHWKLVCINFVMLKMVKRIVVPLSLFISGIRQMVYGDLPG